MIHGGMMPPRPRSQAQSGTLIRDAALRKARARPTQQTGRRHWGTCWLREGGDRLAFGPWAGSRGQTPLLDKREWEVGALRCHRKAGRGDRHFLLAPRQGVQIKADPGGNRVGGTR